MFSSLVSKSNAARILYLLATGIRGGVAATVLVSGMSVASYAFLDRVVGPDRPVVTAPLFLLSSIDAVVPSAPGSCCPAIAMSASRPVFLLGRPVLTSFL